MGIFSANTGDFDENIENATSEKNTSEKWNVIMDICDKVGHGSANAKECLRTIIRRLNHNDPHVVMQAITLLDACVNNCGKNFHLEIASREFETEFKKLLTKTQPQVVARLKQCLKKWAEGDFKNDPSLNLIPSMYHKLKSEGHDFTDSSASVKKPAAPLSKDPNVVASQQEEDDIAKAIELSLKEKDSPKAKANSSSLSNSTAAAALYPTMSMGAAAQQAEPRKVRALYDFEAAEDNELTFLSGEIIMVLDDSDPNWWKGQNQRGEGLFPSNFVTADLDAEPEPLYKSASDSKSKKSVQFSDENAKNEHKEVAAAAVEVNEMTLDRLLHLLHEADPEDPSQDTDEMLRLEAQVNQMGPLIDSELERVDRKHAQLTQLSSDLVDSINLYHTLMRESDRPEMGMGYPMNYPGPMSMYGGVPPGMFQPGMQPPGMYQQQMPSMMGMPSMGPQSMPGPMMGYHQQPPHQQQPPVPMQNGGQPQQQPHSAANMMTMMQQPPQMGGPPPPQPAQHSMPPQGMLPQPPQNPNQYAPPPPMNMQPPPQMNTHMSPVHQQHQPTAVPGMQQPQQPQQQQQQPQQQMMMGNTTFLPQGMLSNFPQMSAPTPSMNSLMQTNSNQNIPIYQQQR